MLLPFIVLADVIAMFSSIEQMLSPYLAYVYQEADVIAFDCIDRCYCNVFIYIALSNMHTTVVEADVVCLEEDSKSTFCEVYYVWQMLLPGGRWNTTRVEAGRCYSQVADGMTTVLCYF